MSKPLSMLSVGLVPSEDTGYTKICPRCAIRYGDNPFKRGKPRELAMVMCQPCADKPLQTFEKRYGHVKKPLAIF